MIMMTNGVDRRFVFESAVKSYRDKGYVPEEAETVADAIVVNEAPEETESIEVTEPKELVQNENGKWVCPYCGKEYSTKANLQKHISKEHEDEE